MEQRDVKHHIFIDLSLFTNYFNKQDFLLCTLSLEPANRREQPEGIISENHPA